MTEQALAQLLSALPIYVVFVIIAAMLYVLAKGADILVDNAVVLSAKSGMPKTLIGATIVSLGTTLPEVAVSVVAAAGGDSGLALGNAVGSIICDTGLILGVATLIAPLKLQARIVNRQGWLQTGAGVLLVGCSLLFVSPARVLIDGGRLPRFVGFGFLALLVLYIAASIRWAKTSAALPGDPAPPSAADGSAAEPRAPIAGSPVLALAKLIAGIALVIIASKILIPAVEDAARRLHIPESIIGATLVAFGTSLPELVTAITSTRKGHGDLALGNVIGADILNVLFVVGAATAITPGGLMVPVQFFRILFPIMLSVLVVFRMGVATSRNTLKRPFGVTLVALYVASTVISYLFDIGP